MLNNPYFLAVGFVMFLGCVFNAVVEYRKWRASKRAEKVRMVRDLINEAHATRR